MRSPEILQLIHLLSRLPGLGPRSGRKMALHFLKHKERVLLPFIDHLQAAAAKIKFCTTCHNLDTNYPQCSICSDIKRDHHTLCVVEEVDDLWALERSGVFKGVYHVLGGVLSAMNNVNPQHLTFEQLEARVAKGGIDEMILAMNPTLDGQTTLHYLLDILKPYGIKLTTLAHGIPMGGELNYLDDGTLTTAFAGRRILAA